MLYCAIQDVSTMEHEFADLLGEKFCVNFHLTRPNYFPKICGDNSK